MLLFKRRFYHQSCGVNVRTDNNIQTQLFSSSETLSVYNTNAKYFLPASSANAYSSLHMEKCSEDHFKYRIFVLLYQISKVDQRGGGCITMWKVEIGGSTQVESGNWGVKTRGKWKLGGKKCGKWKLRNEVESGN